MKENVVNLRRGRSSSQNRHGVTVVPVRGRRDLDAFIRVPEVLHRDDPAWISPLRWERRLHLERRSPYSQHAEWEAWVARRRGRLVGRVSAQVDRLHRAIHGSDTGHFGFLDGEDDGEVFSALLAAAEGWLQERGARTITGPFNLSINQECGVLVDGFEHPPMIMMPHNRAWYGSRLEQQGYRPAVDLLAYRVRSDFAPPSSMSAVLRRYQGRIQVRPLARRRMAEELATLRGLFEDAWAENWGFVPYTVAEFNDLGRTLGLLVPDDFIQIALLDDEPAAFIVGMPDLNYAARDLGGRLWPTGWARLAWRLLGRRIPRGRIALMGVARRHQHGPLGAALAFQVIAAVKEALWRRGIVTAELSWILDTNTGMRTILETIGSDLYKRYRLYRKVLEEQAPSP